MKKIFFWIHPIFFVGAIFIYIVLISSHNSLRDDALSSYFLSVAGGIHAGNYIDEVPIYEIARWLLFIFYWLLMISTLVMYRTDVLYTYEVIRKRTYIHWAISCYREIILGAFFYTFIGLIVVWCSFLLTSYPEIEEEHIVDFMLQGSFILVHFIFLGILLFTITALKKSYIHSVISVFSIEAVSLLVGFKMPKLSAFLPGMWGMFQQSKKILKDDGIPVLNTITIQLIGCVIFLAVLNIHHKKHIGDGRWKRK